MYMIRLLDFAFFFYSNYPCILTFAELQTDLPCDSSVFECEHPFAQEEFCFSRNTTANDAMQLLFQPSDPVPGAHPLKTRMTSSLLLKQAGKIRSRIITLQDLYLLAHSKLDFLGLPATYVAKYLPSNLFHDTNAGGLVFANSERPRSLCRDSLGATWRLELFD